MRVPLNEGEKAALKVECPLCGQKPDKKCRTTRTTLASLGTSKLTPRPHKARVVKARNEARRGPSV